MRSSITRLRGAILAGTVALVLAPSAPAQTRLTPPQFQVNPAILFSAQANLAALNRIRLAANINRLQNARFAGVAAQTSFNSSFIPYLGSYFSPGQAAANYANLTQGWSPLAQTLLNTSAFSAASPLVNPYAAASLPALGAATLTSNPYALSAGLASDPYAGSPGLAGAYGGAAGGTPYYNPYGSYYYDPYGGYFRGVGDLVTSYGKYYNQYQDARQKSVQVEQAKIDLRKNLFDEWLYYRSKMPKYNDLREESIKRDLNYARTLPNSTDILSGSSLNTLLAHLKDAQAKGLRGPTIDLDPETLKKINVRTDRGGNIGLLKNGGKLSWPLPLRLPVFDELRKSFELHAEQAVERANVDGKPIDKALLQDLRTELSAMDDTLDKNVNKLSIGAFSEGKRYLNLLQDAVRALEDPNVSDYFHGKYAAQGKSVDKLIDYMIKNGLAFAAATPGDEAAYRALQIYLAAYDDGLTRLAAR